MAFSMTIQTQGLEQTIQNLQQLANEQPNVGPFLSNVCVPALQRLFRSAFDGGLGGWRPLKRSTRKQKAEDGYPTTPNVRTRHYRNECIRLAGMTISGYNLRIVSPVPYAAFLEFGTRTSPARPVFSRVAREMRKEIGPLYQAWARGRRP